MASLEWIANWRNNETNDEYLNEDIDENNLSGKYSLKKLGLIANHMSDYFYLTDVSDYLNEDGNWILHLCVEYMYTDGTWVDYYYKDGVLYDSKTGVMNS